MSVKSAYMDQNSPTFKMNLFVELALSNFIVRPRTTSRKTWML